MQLIQIAIPWIYFHDSTVTFMLYEFPNFLGWLSIQQPVGLCLLTILTSMEQHLECFAAGHFYAIARGR
jgi:hypothetical protein